MPPILDALPQYPRALLSCCLWYGQSTLFALIALYLCERSYNYVLRMLYDHIHRYFDRFLPREKELLRENYQDLCEIFEAVEKGQAAKAHLLAQNHVYRFNRIMEENEQKRQGAEV